MSYSVYVYWHMHMYIRIIYIIQEIYIKFYIYKNIGIWHVEYASDVFVWQNMVGHDKYSPYRYNDSNANACCTTAKNSLIKCTQRDTSLQPTRDMGFSAAYATTSWGGKIRNTIITVIRNNYLRIVIWSTEKKNRGNSQNCNRKDHLWLSHLWKR